MKYLFILLFVLIAPKTMAQTEFGVKTGLSLTFFNENQEQFGENPETDIGYYAGIFLDFEINKGFHFQPELIYKTIGEFQFINAPLYLEYDVAERFSLLLGPSLNYFFDFFSNNFKVRADVSAAYDIATAFELNLKYSFGFEEISPNVLFFGIGFNL